MTIHKVKTHTKKIKREIEMNIDSPHVDIGYLSDPESSNTDDEQL